MRKNLFVTVLFGLLVAVAAHGATRRADTENNRRGLKEQEITETTYEQALCFLCCLPFKPRLP
jgi:hypothetical protein